MENPVLDSISRTFNVELPKFQEIDEYLDFIIPNIKPFSDDLREEDRFLGTRWLEISDDDDFHETILHIFNEGGEYLYIIEGEVAAGSWRILEASNSFILEKPGGGEELYDLAFLNREFFILKKHGDQKRRGRKKYFIIGKESSVGRLEWRDTMEKLFNIYRFNSLFVLFLVVFGVLIVLFLVFSFW